MEKIDIVDKDGRPTGKWASRKVIHKNGLRHKTVHIWIVNSKGQILIQKRSPQKESHPNMWDVSCAGHISAGDTPLKSGLRELKEELGLKVPSNKLKFLFTARNYKILNHRTYFDNELNDVYLLKMNVDSSKIKRQKIEVSEVKLIEIKELRKLIKSKDKTFAPHAREYKGLFKYLSNNL